MAPQQLLEANPPQRSVEGFFVLASWIVDIVSKHVSDDEEEEEERKVIVISRQFAFLW
jgi:hypothetical protein